METLARGWGWGVNDEAAVETVQRFLKGLKMELLHTSLPFVANNTIPQPG
jgi:hypothetical protein